VVVQATAFQAGAATDAASGARLASARLASARLASRLASLTGLAAGLASTCGHEGEGHDVHDLLDERRDRQSHEPPILGDYGRDVHAHAVSDGGQLRLIADRKRTDHGDQAGHERSVLTIEDIRILAI